MRKRLSIFISLFLIITVLGGCYQGVDMGSAFQRRIYADDNYLAGRETSCSVVNWNSNMPDSLKIGSLTGSKEALVLTVPEEGGTLSIDYTVTAKGGDFKLIFRTTGEGFAELVEGSGSGGEIYSLSAGDYAIVAVGIQGGAEIEFTLSASENITAIVPGVMGPDIAVELNRII